MNKPLYLIAQLGFIVLTFVFFGLVVRHLKLALGKTQIDVRKQKKIFNLTLAGLLGWTALISILSLLGIFSDFSTFPPKVGIVLVVPLATLIWVLLFSPTTRQILFHVDPGLLIQLQVFRLFVEVLLWFLFIINLLPIQMTFEGRNWDILAGTSAPLVAYFGIRKFSWPKWVLITWNFFCLGLLINIVVTALLSMPTPFRYFMNEPSNTIVTHFPIIWLPGLLVPLAYGLHFLSLRQLLTKSS
ncbi:MAG: hypothetical protein RLN86_09665 [Cyclobacteriaceae bacterium]